MLKSQAHRMFSVLTALVFAGLLAAAVAPATCEEGEEGFAAVEVSPTSLKMVFESEAELTIKNTGTQHLNLSIGMATGKYFVLEDPNKCQGKTLAPGNTCKVVIWCGAWEKHDTFHVTSVPMASHETKLNSTA